jgi:two-component system, OmpR family, sensor kinase
VRPVPRHSLRLRLTLACLALLSIGLIGVGVVTYRLVESFLVERIDQQLADRAPSALRYFTIRGDQLGAGPPPDFLQRTGPGFLRNSLVFGLVDARGRVVATNTTGVHLENLPSGLPGSAKNPGLQNRTSFDIAIGSDSYRALAVPFSAGPYNGTLVFALPLHDVNSTLDEILLAELILGAVAVIAVGLAVWWLVRRGLRPLERMAETATAIAGGDLSRRVEEGGTSEIGELGVAFNGMLAQIEGEVAERRASEERLRRFAADASHELRTPLTSIRGYAELFRRGAADRPEDLALTMRRIESEATRMTSLVDDLLLLARLDRKRPLERSLVDVGRLVRDIVAGERIVHPDRDYRLRMDDVRVLGDEARLRQVLLNLLANAASHTPAGTPIDLSAPVDRGEAVIEVADHGDGLTPEDADRVFERFFRVDAARARGAGGGSGLGLAIVAAIVDAHGGRVEVESVPGHGARFRVRLPASQEADVPVPVEG